MLNQYNILQKIQHKSKNKIDGRKKKHFLLLKPCITIVNIFFTSSKSFIIWNCQIIRLSVS